ncbi:PAS domain-containing protein [candidate division KSB1 bacterium]|nr:PAS domain-containing protein [candidate division KSB1 bacterium]
MTKLLPDWEQGRIKNLVHQLLTALNIYLIDQKLDAAVQHVFKIVRDHFTELSGQPDILVNALLISRYILLATIARTSKSPIDSLELFSNINDIYDPFIKAVGKELDSGSDRGAENLPKDFIPALEKGLLSIDFAGIGLFILDKQLNFIHWSRGLESLYHISAHDVLGENILVKFPAFQEEESFLHALKQASEIGQPAELYGIKHKSLNAGNRIIDFKIAPLMETESGVIGVSVLVHDITDHERLREHLVHSEKLSAVGTLAAGFAHEVGSPLNSISALAQVLKDKATDEYFKEKTALIQQYIDRIARTVRTLVDFSQPTAHKIENVYLNMVIDHVIRIIKYDKRLKYQQIITHLDPHIPQVVTSFDQILQVFINICLNAADAMQGIKDGQLQLRTWADERYVYSSVTDNGHGISKEDINHIFEPFFTTKQKGQGTGLGLWVSYNIVKNYSGRIEVESEPDVGTTFTISLPIKKD